MLGGLSLLRPRDTNKELDMAQDEFFENMKAARRKGREAWIKTCQGLRPAEDPLLSESVFLATELVQDMYIMLKTLPAMGLFQVTENTYYTAPKIAHCKVCCSSCHHPWGTILVGWLNDCD